MKLPVSSATAGVSGVFLLYLAVSDKYILYVQSQMKVPLLVSALILFVLAGLALISSNSRSAESSARFIDEAMPTSVARKAGKSAARKRRKASAKGPKSPAAIAASKRREAQLRGRIHQSDHGTNHDHDHGLSEQGHDHAHEGHGHGGGITWLLVVPVLVVLIFSPPSLGTSSATKTNLQKLGLAYLPIPESPSPARLTLAEYVDRSFEESGVTLQNRTLELVGFGVPPKTGAGFILIRFSIACCAADGMASEARILGKLPRLPKASSNDQVWLKVIGSHVSNDGDIPTFKPISVVEIDAPKDPYE